MFAADLHIHTKHSPDSIMEPRRILKVAALKGLSAVAVTDHDTMRGVIRITEEASTDSVLMVPGIEMRTTRGEITGLFVQKEPKTRAFPEVVVRDRKSQNPV